MKKIIILWIFVAFGLVTLGSVEKLMYPIKYSEFVSKYSRAYGLDRDYVFAVIKAESGFDSNAVSHKGAVGLMQLMEETGASAAKKLNIKNYDLKDPETNINFGCWYLKTLISEHDSLYVATAAYNAGSKNVKSWFVKTDYKKLTPQQFINNIKYNETKNFVKRVFNNYQQYKRIYKEKVEG